MRKFVGIEVYEWVKGDNKTNLDDRKKIRKGILKVEKKQISKYRTDQKNWVKEF